MYHLEHVYILIIYFVTWKLSSSICEAWFGKRWLENGSWRSTRRNTSGWHMLIFTMLFTVNSNKLKRIFFYIFLIKRKGNYASENCHMYMCVHFCNLLSNAVSCILFARSHWVVLLLYHWWMNLHGICLSFSLRYWNNYLVSHHDYTLMCYYSWPWT